MQERHTNRERYFEEQVSHYEKLLYTLYKKNIGNLPNKVLEVGCGEGGNLLPFAELGCDTIGIDIAVSRIEQAKTSSLPKSKRNFYCF